jgi:hypothetical protein
MFKRQREESKACFNVSYVIAEKISKKSETFLDGKFVKVSHRCWGNSVMK